MVTHVCSAQRHVCDKVFLRSVPAKGHECPSSDRCGREEEPLIKLRGLGYSENRKGYSTISLGTSYGLQHPVLIHQYHEYAWVIPACSNTSV